MSQLIPLQQAVEMTTLYRKEKENILDPLFRNKNILALSETFDRSDFDIVLSEQGCVALRIYYGMDDSLKVHAIIVGVNDKDQDILPATEMKTPATTGGDGSLIEEGTRCPDICPPGSSLNGG
jgi:hypothetical protein